jgi:glutaredoxin-related protein
LEWFDKVPEYSSWGDFPTYIGNKFVLGVDVSSDWL